MYASCDEIHIKAESKFFEGRLMFGINTENTYLLKYLTARPNFKLFFYFDFVNDQCCQMIGQIATKIPKYHHFLRHSNITQKLPHLATL